MTTNISTHRHYRLLGVSAIGLEACLGFAIVLVPFLSFLHLFFSNSADIIQVIGFSWEHGARNNQLFAWNIFNSLCPFLILTMIYFGSREKARHILLIPISYYLIDVYSIVRWENFTESVLRIEAILLVLVTLISFWVIGKELITPCLSRGERITQRAILLEAVSKRLKRIHNEILINLEFSKTESLLKRTYKIYRTIELLSSVQEGSVRKRNNKFWSAIIITSTIVCFLINFAWHLFPSEKELTIGFIKIQSYGFKSVEAFMWYMLGKLSIGSLLLLWFFVSKGWWRLALLIPISLYGFQIWDSFQITKSIEAESHISLTPIILILIGLIVYSALTAYRISRAYRVKELLDAELDSNLNELSKKRMK